MKARTKATKFWQFEQIIILSKQSECQFPFQLSFTDKSNKIFNSDHFQNKTSSTNSYKETRPFPIPNGTQIPTLERITNRTEMKALIIVALIQSFLSGTSSNIKWASRTSSILSSIGVKINSKIINKLTKFSLLTTT